MRSSNTRRAEDSPRSARPGASGRLRVHAWRLRPLSGKSAPGKEVRRREYLAPGDRSPLTVAGPRRNRTGFLWRRRNDGAEISTRRDTSSRSSAYPSPLPGVESGETETLELVEPPPHRPPAPTLVEQRGVGEDVVEMLDRWVRYRVVLVEGVGAADPGHRHSGTRGLLPEIGVLAAVSAVGGAEPADAVPHERPGRERQRPEQFVPVVQHDLTRGGERTGRMRIDRVAEPVEVVAAGTRFGHIGDRTAEQRSRVPAGRLDISFDQV